MKNVSKSLAAVAEVFVTSLNEANYQTQTGKELINKYQSYAMNNELSCSVVNNFIKEASNMKYDSGVVSVLESISTMIDASKYSWLLESACEKIEMDNRAYNFCNRYAAKNVRPLLEMAESDVVAYIKAGALKDVSFCEPFRNIAKSVFKDIPVVESTTNFTITHPISIVENINNSLYFVVEKNIYKMTNEKVEKANINEVSKDFLTIANILESGAYSSSNNGTLSFNFGKFSFAINEEGKCKKISGEKIQEYNIEQLREHNALLVNGVLPASRNTTSMQLESVAKCCENYDNIVVLDNVSVIETASDKFVVIESREGDVHAFSLASKKAQPWSVTNNIYEVVSFIKKRTNVDLSERFSDKIESVIEKAEEKDAQMIKESIQKDAIQQRKEKIEELTQRFKNDPVKLAVLSKVAQDLNEL